MPGWPSYHLPRRLRAGQPLPDPGQGRSAPGLDAGFGVLPAAQIRAAVYDLKGAVAHLAIQPAPLVLADRERQPEHGRTVLVG